MKSTTTIRQTVWEDSTCYVLARIIGGTGVAIKQADVSSIACKVFDESAKDPNVVVVAPTIVVATAVYDAMQTSDPRWTVDATGFNYLHRLPVTAFPVGDHTYRVEYVFTMVNGDAFPFVLLLQAKGLRSS